MNKALLVSWLAISSILSAKADLLLAPIFSDHAVVQRDKPVTVWGTATAGNQVRVIFHSQEVAALAGPDGKWTLALPALPADNQGTDMIVNELSSTGAVEHSITLHDILIGEVWLCSGQSNMEFKVYEPKLVHFKLDNVAHEVASANYPLIRQLLVSRKMHETSQQFTPAAWSVCSPDTVGHFTAVGYFFARDIYERLHIPIGIINSTWGGTSIESWLSPDSLQNHPLAKTINQRFLDEKASYPDRLLAYQSKLDNWKKGLTASKPKYRAGYIKKNPQPKAPTVPSQIPSGLYNGMINPIVPYSLRGILWYQGENNAGRASEYHSLFNALITGWRTHFAQGDLPFFWVQLANYKSPGDTSDVAWAFLREAQTQTLSLPNTGQAITIDIGNPNDIHPGNKQEVGRRLALLAKNRVYGISVDDTGPTFKSIAIEGSSIRVSFVAHDSALTAGGKPLQAFEIAGADRNFIPAQATISGETIIVRSPKIDHPVAVRYAWHNAPEANLYSGYGLPAVPFSSDSW